MHNHTKAPIAVLTAAVAACLLAAPVLADPAPAQATATAEATQPAADAPGMTTGSVNVEDKAKKQLADCMAIWEPRTHMSKSEWRRTCKTSLKEF